MNPADQIDKQRQIEALLQLDGVEDDAPAFVDHGDNEGMCAPSGKIKAYLKALMAAIGEELPASWADEPPEGYQQRAHKLRRSCEQLHDYVASQELPPQQQRDQQISLRLVSESAMALLHLDATRPLDWTTASSESIELLRRRPRPKIALDQLYCTPDSTERRAMAALHGLTDPSGKLLCLGDDDLCSLVLAAQAPPSAEVHAVDFDHRLLEHITATAPAVRTHHCDLIQGGLPKAFVEAFDAVLLDPPWDAYGTWNFLDKAILALRPGIHGRIYLSFCPVYIEHIDRKMDRFWAKLARRGLICEQVDPAFHLYHLEGTQFSTLLQHQLPTIESPLFACLRQVPYGFSHLYTLRRLARTPKDYLGDAWRRWWHVA